MPAARGGSVLLPPLPPLLPPLLALLALPGPGPAGSKYLHRITVSMKQLEPLTQWDGNVVPVCVLEGSWHGGGCLHAVGQSYHVAYLTLAAFRRMLKKSREPFLQVGTQSCRLSLQQEDITPVWRIRCHQLLVLQSLSS